MYSAVFCAVMHGIPLFFIIWFTDILLYEYVFKDKWYRLELLASVVLYILHSDCIKIYDEVMLLYNAHRRGPQHILMPGKGTILSFKQILMGGLFFSVSFVSFKALFISPPPPPHKSVNNNFISRGQHIWHNCQSNIWSSDTKTYMRLIIAKQWKLFTVCTEQVRSPYIEHAASGLPNPTRLEGEVRFVQAQDQQVLPHVVRES